MVNALDKYGRNSVLASSPFWEQQVKARGGLLGRAVELIIRADGSDPVRGEQLYEELIGASMGTILPGRFRVDPRGMAIGHDLLTVQWQGTEKALVWPPKYLTARYKLLSPAWSERR